MCIFGGGDSPPQDNSAELARQQEEQRQARIRAGKTNIDKTFAGFTDAFYNKAGNDYKKYYEPQLRDQFQEAIRKQTLGLAQTGNINASEGARELGDVRKKYATSQTDIADKALNTVNELKNRVAQNKSDLYQTNIAVADPLQAATSAQAARQAIQTPISYGPLGDVFSSVIRVGGQQLGLEAQGYPGLRTGIFDRGTGGSGSGNIVRS